MKHLFAVSALALAASLAPVVHAGPKPAFVLRCGPYGSGSTAAKGARGACINGCFATKCKGKTTKLTWVSDASVKNQNRRDSGCSKFSLSPCSNTTITYGSSGNSCDEYPVASSAQGGAGSILRCVDASENSSQGGQLSAWATANNAAAGDTFDYTFSLEGTVVPYCATPPASCVNDGSEFGLTNNVFSNAHREGTGVDEETLPIFKTSGGHLIAMSNKVNALNSTVWMDGDDGGFQTIERQLSAAEVLALPAAVL